MLPSLSPGSACYYLPLGDNLAGFQPVDWDILAAVQLPPSLHLQAQSSCVLHRAIWFGSVSP